MCVLPEWLLAAGTASHQAVESYLQPAVTTLRNQSTQALAKWSTIRSVTARARRSRRWHLLCVARVVKFDGDVRTPGLDDIRRDDDREDPLC